jgi:hypothetical protein
MLLLGAFIAVSNDPMALATGTLPWTGDGVGLLELGLVLTPTLAPYALFFDRKYVYRQTGWLPSAWYFLVAVPYLGVFVTVRYVWKRFERVDAL